MDLCVKRNYNTLIHHLKKKEKKNMTKTYSMLICPIFLFVLMHHIFGIIIVESIGLRSTGKKKKKKKLMVDPLHNLYLTRSDKPRYFPKHKNRKCWFTCN